MDHERIYALFLNGDEGLGAINYLIQNGYDTGHISVVAQDEAGQFAKFVNTTNHIEIKGDTALSFGAVAGALVGLVVMQVPELGPIIAAGPIAATLTGVAAGAALGAGTGGAVASLIELGVNEEDVRRYRNVLSEGGVLIVTDNFKGNWQRDKLENVFHAHNAIDVKHYSLL